jgi:thioredoxin reductase (NADPH)
MENQAHVGIVGAGPIGLELAVALKKAGLSTLHFDSRQIGHTISWFAPQTRFFSSNDRIAIAGVPLQTADQSKASREEYLAYLRSIVEQFDLNVRTFESVVRIDRGAEQFVLTTLAAAGEKTYRVSKLVLCTGGTERPRRLNIPGEDLPHVSHYFQDPHPFFRKQLLIVGGKNSAVEAALRCHRAGSFVTMSYRREKLEPSSIKYWLMPEISGLLESGKIKGHFNTTLARIEPGVVTLARAGGESFDVNADFVLLLVGYEADMSLCKLAGVELEGPCQAPCFDARTMQTNVPGIFVAGTAVGGTQDRYRVFIENCHVHVQRIVAALTGKPPPPETPSPTEKLET